MVDEEEEKALNHLNLNLHRVTVPDRKRKIYISKCTNGSATTRSKRGLFIEMLSLLPYGHGYLQQLCKGHNTTIFLNIKHRKKPAILKDADGADELANGYLQTCTVVAMPQKYTIPYPTGCMPDKVRSAVQAILAAADSDPPLESTYVDISTEKGVHGHSNTMDDTGELIFKRPKIYEAPDYGKMKLMHTESVLPARHVLDALDNIRLLNVKHDGIPLPTIVVVGDQSSGKSSLLTSLAGICLPSGASMVTRVPLILRLYHIETNKTEIVLKYGITSKILISEDDIPMAIEKATSEITGDSSGVSSSPITLVVKKRGITDLTLVDLPGLIRVAAPDQPPDICEQIRGIVQEYTKPEEAIILNVIHANQDFATTNSLEMSQAVDPSGQRTLTVITKCDCLDSPLFADKLTSNKLNIGLGFICVRNRIGEESIKEAEHAEESLFSAHPVLSTIDKAMVGIPVLVKKLKKIQMNIMREFLPHVIAKIDDTLESLYLERSKMPRQLNNDAEAMDAFMRLAASLRSAIQEFSGDSKKTARKARIMSCSAKLDSLLKRLHDDLSKTEKGYETFLSDEVEFVKANTGLRLPGGFAQNLFDLLLREKVEDIRKLPSKCAADALSYFEKGCMKVVYDQFSSHYPLVLPVAEDAVRMCMNDITEIVMERTEEITTMQWYDFTIDSSFLNAYEKFKSENKGILLSALDSEMRMANLLVFGKVDVAHLRIIPSSIRDHAFELRMRLELYWTIVVTRIVDSLAQRLRMMLADAETKIEQLMVRNVLGETGRVSKLMGEPESMTKKRDHLQETISVLKKSRDVLASFSP